MISYCVVSIRPDYSMLVIEELSRKTTCRPYEILLWMNFLDKDGEYRNYISKKQRDGVPVRIVGHTPGNIGMNAYKELFLEAKYDFIVQMDEDVLFISKRIGEIALEIFARNKNVDQLVSDVWQDEFTTGARPGMDSYVNINLKDGLYDGPIDGWFSIYRRSILPILLEAPYERHFYLGSFVWGKLKSLGRLGCLCTRMKVFHACGPIYAHAFGLLDFEIEKFRNVGNKVMADAYESVKGKLPEVQVLEDRVMLIREHIDNFEK